MNIVPVDFSYVYPGADHKLLAEPGKEVFYFWMEFIAAENTADAYKPVYDNIPLADAYTEWAKIKNPFLA